MSQTNQRAMVEAMQKFFGLQIVQNAVILEVVVSRQLLQGWIEGMERSQHNRDWHGCPWDMDFVLERKKYYENELFEATKRFNANQMRLNELNNEIVALMTAS